MKKLLNLIQSLTPKSFILFFMRLTNVVKPTVYDEGIHIKIASTKEELLEAYKLLYQAYVSAGLMDENYFKLRCNLYTFLPTTVTIIACIGDEVVGTVAAIRDGTFGLPSDKEFLKENEDLRKNDGVICEISALAVKKEFRYKDHRVSLLLMKYVYNFTRDYFKCTNSVIIVHPRTENFYQAYLQFKKKGPVVRYNFVKGALGIHMQSDLRAGTQLKYASQKMNRFARFLYESDQNCLFPVFNEGQVVVPVMDRKKFSEFMGLAGLKLSDFKMNEMIALVSLYRPVLQNQNSHNLIKNIREFRYPMEKNAVIKYEGLDIIVRINNISVTGVFIQSHLDLLEVGQKIQITIEINKNIYHLSSTVAWSNENRKSTSLPCGVGVKFDQEFFQLNQEIQNWSGGIATADNFRFAKKDQLKIA